MIPMTDIVTKLNNWSKYATAGQRAVLQEAMREIIKTRSALQKIGYGPPCEGDPVSLLNEFVDIAQKTLEQKGMLQ